MSNLDSSSAAMRTAQEFVEAILSRGVREVVLSPGSRSGPLALAVAAADKQKLLRLHVRLDEREAGFLALGLAKAGGRPVSVITTSGTAVANLHPALLEAWHANVPVLAVTADRPARLRGTGANQTTNQIGILPPLVTLDSLAKLPTDVSGPVHLNLELDQPLIAPGEWEFAPSARGDSSNLAPTASAAAGTETIAGAELLETLALGARTVVVAGDNSPPVWAEIAAEAGWPILAEPSSNLRGAATAVATGRLLLGVPHFANRIERVISLGHATISRPVTALLSRTDIPIEHVGEARTFPVPAGKNVTFHNEFDSQAFRKTSAADESQTRDEEWLGEWIAADQKILAALPDDPTLRVAALVGASATSDAIVTLGPSQVLRDCDLMFPVRSSVARVLSNRGLAGIDGVLSTAIGATLAHGGRGLAYVGDLTFLHGSNGLLLGPEEPRPDLTIVVLNDEGGSIFASLEQGAPEFREHFERVYATPVAASIENLCRGMNIDHRTAESTELADELAKPANGISVIEVKVSRAHRPQLNGTIATTVAGLF